MTTYTNLLKDAIANESVWKHDREGLAGNLDLSNAESCHTFISNFLRDLDKNQLGISRELMNLEDFRWQHIVSVFFLGIAIYDKSRFLHDNIDQSLSKFGEAVGRHHSNPFPLMWILIVLFHDLAYHDENEHKYRNYQDLISELKTCDGWTERNLGEIVGVPVLYEDIVEKYFKYISNVFNKSDHGICAGLKMYNDCNIQRIKNNWNEGLQQVYNYAAWVITCHNMWTASDKDTIVRYKRRGLNSLIWEKDNFPIRAIQYPVFWLFCLVDSIEPIKVVRDATLLEKISLRIEDSEITIKFNLSCGCQQTMLSKVDSLSKWLVQVNINEAEDNTRIIRIR